MNRSAKDGRRSSPHYGDEGKTHSPIATRCVRAARSGRIEHDPGELAGSHTRKTEENSGFSTPLPYVFAARRTVGQSDFGGFLRSILKRGLANEVNDILSLPERKSLKTEDANGLSML